MGREATGQVGSLNQIRLGTKAHPRALGNPKGPATEAETGTGHAASGKETVPVTHTRPQSPSPKRKNRESASHTEAARETPGSGAAQAPRVPVRQLPRPNRVNLRLAHTQRQVSAITRPVPSRRPLYILLPPRFGSGERPVKPTSPEPRQGPPARRWRPTPDEALLLADEPLRLDPAAELELRSSATATSSARSTAAALAVARSDGSSAPLPDEAAAAGSESDCKVSKIYGVAGMIRLLAGSYDLSSLRKDAGSYGASTKRDEAYFMSLLRIAETTCGLYYSYDRDLTLNLQRASKLAAGRVHKPLWKQADPRFVWNRNLLEELIEAK
ncbi:hypothetical protein ZWY2020_042145, partial [Hordeum vulgare]